MPSWRILRGAFSNIDKGPTLVEITFAMPGYCGSFTITDAAVTATSSVFVQQSMAAATGKAADENELDALLCRALPAAGSFTVFIDAMPGPVVGAFKLCYEVR